MDPSRRDTSDGADQQAPSASAAASPDHPAAPSPSDAVRDAVSTVLESIRAFYARRKPPTDDYELVAGPREAVTAYRSIMSKEEQTGFWGPLFLSFWIRTHDPERDDLLFFVRAQNLTSNPARPRPGSNGNIGGHESDPFFVVRVQQKDKLPAFDDPSIDWEASFHLNLILNQFEYELVVGIAAQRTQMRGMRLLSRASKKVFASPSTRQMDGKANHVVCTYPMIYFTIDNFDEVFATTVVLEKECLCIELIAKVRGGDAVSDQSVLFQGTVTYELLCGAFARKQRRSSRTQIVSAILSKDQKRRRVEFLRLRGPGGKGEAEVAMSVRQGKAGEEMTPKSDPLCEPSPALSRSSSSVSAHSTASTASATTTTTTTTSPLQSAWASIKRFGSSLSDPQSASASSASGAAPEGSMFNAFVTFVSLEWRTIVDDIVSARVKPVLRDMPIHKGDL